MPRNIPGPIQDAINSGSARLSILTELVRRDGVVHRFTDAGDNIIFGGNEYLASDSVGQTTFQSQVGTAPDNFDVMGVLSDSSISESDIAGGRFDSAALTVRLVERGNLAAGAVILFVGSIGEISVVDGQFTAEVRAESHKLKQTVGDSTSATCRAKRLGDARCKVNLAGTVRGFPIQSTRSLISGGGFSLTFGSEPAASGHYSYGIVKFTTGANAGIEREIKVHALVSGRAVLTLRTPFPFAVNSGDTAILEAGCDRLLTMCRDDFANANNFRGEWFLPGNDKILRIGRPPG